MDRRSYAQQMIFCSFNEFDLLCSFLKVLLCSFFKVLLCSFFVNVHLLWAKVQSESTKIYFVQLNLESNSITWFLTREKFQCNEHHLVYAALKYKLFHKHFVMSHQSTPSLQNCAIQWTSLTRFWFFNSIHTNTDSSSVSRNNDFFSRHL